MTKSGSIVKMSTNRLSWFSSFQSQKYKPGDTIWEEARANDRKKLTEIDYVNDQMKKTKNVSNLTEVGPLGQIWKAK